jgi:hypothetical protein
MPGSRRPNSARSDVSGNRRTELQDPAADRFIADIDPTFCKHFLNITIAQRKAKVETDGSLDYRWWKSVAFVGNLSHSTTNTGRQADRRVNVTMPCGINSVQIRDKELCYQTRPPPCNNALFKAEVIHRCGQCLLAASAHSGMSTINTTPYCASVTINLVGLTG